MLPGKLCIGILEEDNPLKAYFRLKPLLMEKDGQYLPYETQGKYPEDGCIRIVPDKNESSHFKARMRRMGKYCVLDLRSHTEENDKIRPNKNYKTDDMERNAYIVYSDVVREPAENMIFEIVEQAAPDGDQIEWNGDAPATPCILLNGVMDLWRYVPGEDEQPDAIHREGGALSPDEIQVFHIPGFRDETLHIAIRRPDTLPAIMGAPSVKPEVVQMARPECAAPAPQPPVREEKPWISHDLPPAPPHPNPHMTPMQQILAAQTGLNPRRNRSLQEIIEEKWRHSRVDQLGHPVPGGAMGQPVESPVETAVRAIRRAWSNPAIKAQLLSEMANMEEFSTSFQGVQAAGASEKLRRELEDLEAERLKSLAALDQLRRDKQALREEFKQEIRDEATGDLRDAIDRAKSAKDALERYRAEAEAARKDAEFAQDAIAALEDGRFENRLREFAVNSRAAELIRHPERPEPRIERTAPDGALTRGEWIERTQRAFAAEGMAIDEIEAANLLVCAAIAGNIVISGPAASDKCETARAFARALGAQSAGRYAEIAGGRGKMDRADALLEPSGLLSLALVRDANAHPGADAYRSLQGGGGLIVVASVSDGGFPLSAEALERGFMLRLEAVGPDAPWKPLCGEAAEFAPADADALARAFLKDARDVPESLADRLGKIRQALAKYGVCLSRRTLDMMWRYCAAMLDVGGIAPNDALDRAFAQRALPCILAEAPIDCLKALPGWIADMPRSLALLQKPLPIQI